MKMTVKASSFLEAMDLVSCVTPKPVTPNGISGYLLKVEGNTCYIYSRDTFHVSRSSVEVEGLEDGSAIYPSSNLAALKFLGDQTVTFTSSEEDGAHILEYVTSEGASSKKVTVNPDLFLSCEEEIAAADSGDMFQAGVLHHVLNVVRSFAADPKDTKSEDHFKTVQIFDASQDAYKDGDGYAYAATGTISCSVLCDSFKGKKLAVQVQHLSPLLAFLSKVQGEVTVKHGPNMELVETASGDVFGFSKHHKTHPTFRIYELSKDGFAFRVPRKLFLDTLGFVRAEMDPKESKVRLSYIRNGSRGKPEIKVSVEGSKNTLETFAVPVAPIQEDGEVKIGDRDWSLSVNVDYLNNLVSGVQAHEAHVRVSLVPQRQRIFGLIRTLDTYRVDDSGKVSTAGTHTCTVIRWTPSKEKDLAIFFIDSML